MFNSMQNEVKFVAKFINPFKNLRCLLCYVFLIIESLPYCHDTSSYFSCNFFANTCGQFSKISAGRVLEDPQFESFFLMLVGYGGPEALQFFNPLIQNTHCLVNNINVRVISTFNLNLPRLQ